MKPVPLILGLCLFLVVGLLLVCIRRDAPLEQLPNGGPKHSSDVAMAPPASDTELKKMLPGTWIFDTDVGRLHHRSITTITTNGDYTSEITITRSNKTEVFHIAGTWHVEQGFLIDTLTSFTITKNLPFTTRLPIRRLDENELVAGFGSGNHYFRSDSK